MDSESKRAGPAAVAPAWPTGRVRARAPARRRLVVGGLAATGAAGVAAVVGAGPVRAQEGDWPSRPIRLLIPFPPAGGTDLIGRAIAPALGDVLGQPIIIDNRPGAGGTIGSQAAAAAAPDGHTLLLATSSTHSIGPMLNPRIPYDAFRDFTPIGIVAEGASVLLVGRDSPAATVQQLVELCRRQPGRLNFGSSGVGTYPHLIAELFKWRAGGLFVVHIPYRGTGLVMTDLVSGQVAFLMDSIVSAQAPLSDGKVRALAVTGTGRSPTLADVPTFAEAGISGMEQSNWFGLYGPAGMAEARVARLNAALNQVVAQPATVARFRQLGAEPRSGTPADFDRRYRDEAQTWKALIARANIRLD